MSSRPQAFTDFDPCSLPTKVKPNNNSAKKTNSVYLNAKNGLFIVGLYVDGIFTHDEKSLAHTEASTANTVFSFREENEASREAAIAFKKMDDFAKEFVSNHKEEIFKEGDINDYEFKASMAKPLNEDIQHEQKIMSLRIDPIGIHFSTKLCEYQNASSTVPRMKPNGLRELRRGDKVLVTFRPTSIYFTSDKYGVSYSVDRMCLMNEEGYNPDMNSDEDFCAFISEACPNPKKQRVQ